MFFTWLIFVLLPFKHSSSFSYPIHSKSSDCPLAYLHPPQMYTRQISPEHYFSSISFRFLSLSFHRFNCFLSFDIAHLLRCILKTIWTVKSTLFHSICSMENPSAMRGTWLTMPRPSPIGPQVFFVATYWWNLQFL